MIPSRVSRGAAPPPVFGREEILEETDRLLERTQDGAGAGLLLIGPGGIGKTQVLNAVVERAAKRGFTVLTGRALPEELPPAFSLLRELLESERTAGEMAAASWAPPRVVLAGAPAREGRTPRTAPSMGRASGAPGGDLDQTLAPTALTVVDGLGTGREEMFARLEQHLLERARDQPMLIAVDDLHFADGSTLEFLRLFAGEFPKRRVAFVATLAESADLPERTRDAVETLSGAPNILSVPVRPLNVVEMEDFIRWILGGRAPDRNDVRRWHAQTDGNPLFVEQLVRTATGYITHPRPASEGAQGVTEILLDRVLRRTGRAPPAGGVDLRPRVWFNEDLRSRNYFVPGVAANILLMITLMLTAQAIIREKEMGTMEQLMVTPIRPAELILGKTLPFVLVGFFDMMLVLSAALLIFHIPFNGSFLLLLCSTLLFLLTTLGAGLFISTVSRTQQQASLMTSVLFQPFFMLSGFTFPIRNMPQVAQWLTFLNPVRYFMEIVRGVFLQGAGVAALWTQMTALAVFGVTILWVSVLRFQKHLE